MIEILTPSVRISVDSSLQRMMYRMAYAQQSRIECPNRPLYESPKLRETLNSKLGEKLKNLGDAVLIGKTENSFDKYKLHLRHSKT